MIIHRLYIFTTKTTIQLNDFFFYFSLNIFNFLVLLPTPQNKQPGDGIKCGHISPLRNNRGPSMLESVDVQPPQKSASFPKRSVCMKQSFVFRTQVRHPSWAHMIFSTAQTSSLLVSSLLSSRVVWHFAVGQSHCDRS